MGIELAVLFGGAVTESEPGDVDLAIAFERGKPTDTGFRAYVDGVAPYASSGESAAAD